MSDLILLILGGWALVAFIFLLLWTLAVKQQNAGWVDVGWSLSLVALVGWYALLVDGVVWRRLFMLAICGLWGLRLGIHILQRLQRESEEDPRYAFLRSHWGKTADLKFLGFFQAQGIANLLLTAPVLLLMQVPRPGLSLWDLVGGLLVVAAVLGESAADRQLAAWKANPYNRGRTCRQGLWAYSRHPNYFFEWLHWMAYPLLGGVLWQVGMGPWWLLTLIGPLVMYVLLNRFTGIPYTEKQALRSRGEDYRRYQEEVSPFFPWFPK
jgi:steroid 5-alpha reductase family enzyme